MPKRRNRQTAFHSDSGVRCVREHALANLPRWITVTAAARLVGTRPADFSSRFEELTGVSYDWWNEEIHPEEAKRLLCSPRGGTMGQW
jgi:AraC-like DNA-binding protein